MPPCPLCLCVFLSIRFEVECVLHVGSKENRFVRLRDGPAVELANQEKTDHGVQLGGRSPHVGREVFSKSLDRQLLQQNVAKQTLPA